MVTASSACDAPATTPTSALLAARTSATFWSATVHLSATGRCSEALLRPDRVCWTPLSATAREVPLWRDCEASLRLHVRRPSGNAAAAASKVAGLDALLPASLQSSVHCQQLPMLRAGDCPHGVPSLWHSLSLWRPQAVTAPAPAAQVEHLLRLLMRLQWWLLDCGCQIECSEGSLQATMSAAASAHVHCTAVC
jgi:hypothetical protein